MLSLSTLPDEMVEEILRPIRIATDLFLTPSTLQLLLTFVVAVDLTVAASDVKMSGKNNKTEGLVLSPRDFLTGNPGTFATWFAACCAKANDAGVGSNDIHVSDTQRTT